MFCEGLKTEKTYFERYKSKICQGRCIRRKLPEVKVIPSKNCGAIANIEFINSYARNEGVSDRDGDCLICVIDCDANKSENINQAIKLAKGNKNGSKIKVNICLSNPSFELWYLLHFELCDKPLSQEGLEAKLKNYISDYKKNVDYYDVLEKDMEIAMMHAEYLKKHHFENGIKLLSIESNPSTMVPYFLKHIQNFVIGQ
ncbi:RloB family protein [Methanosarcina siciliae]|uniref:RloB family protein n=1 Tax=Methanosarcina siciliae TaxID=38027 RepID=UPI0009E42BCA|nr:RloB family protein [Methanosarcina siciliae]